MKKWSTLRGQQSAGWTVIVVYAVTLPAIYHHGRYLMPLIPIRNDQVKLAKHVTDVIVFTGYYEEFLKELDAQRVYSPKLEER